MIRIVVIACLAGAFAGPVAASNSQLHLFTVKCSPLASRVQVNQACSHHDVDSHSLTTRNMYMHIFLYYVYYIFI